MSNFFEQNSRLCTDAVPDPPRESENCASNTQNFRTATCENKQSEPIKEPINDSSDPLKNSKDSSTSGFREQKKKQFPKSELPKTEPKAQINNTQNNFTFIGSKFHVGNKYSISVNSQKNQNSSKNKNDKKKSTEIPSKVKEMSCKVKELSESQLEITVNDMIVVKRHIEDWRRFAQELGFSKGEINSIENARERTDKKDVVIDILYKWKEWKVKEATVGNMILAIWRIQEYECVDKYIEEIKGCKN